MLSQEIRNEVLPLSDLSPRIFGKVHPRICTTLFVKVFVVNLLCLVGSCPMFSGSGVFKLREGLPVAYLEGA